MTARTTLDSLPPDRLTKGPTHPTPGRPSAGSTPLYETGPTPTALFHGRRTYGGGPRLEGQERYRRSLLTVETPRRLGHTFRTVQLAPTRPGVDDTGCVLGSPAGRPPRPVHGTQEAGEDQVGPLVEVGRSTLNRRDSTWGRRTKVDTPTGKRHTVTYTTKRQSQRDRQFTIVSRRMFSGFESETDPVLV